MTAATRRLTERDRGSVDGDLHTSDECYRGEQTVSAGPGTAIKLRGQRVVERRWRATRATTASATWVIDLIGPGTWPGSIRPGT